WRGDAGRDRARHRGRGAGGPGGAPGCAAPRAAGRHPRLVAGHEAWVRARAPVAAVVLAAGNSTRLGRPKQLVVYQGLPLVARAARAALATGADPVVLVLGANAE